MTTHRRPTAPTDLTAPPTPPLRLLVLGLTVAVLSAATFGSSGAVAKSLLVQGWSPGAAVTARMVLGAALLAGPAALSMRGHWHLLHRPVTWAHVATFGVLAVAGCQLFYFLAIERLSVGVALMLEYLGPILVVGWLWLVRGQRPRPRTVVGIGVAMLGLVFVLDVLGDARLSPVGVMWGLLAAIGLAAFFVVGADDATGLPPLAFACLGLLVGAATLLLAGALGLVPMHWSTAEATVSGYAVPWWVPVLWLGLVAAAIAYLTGVVAARALGAKVASFVGLTEVMFAVLWAWVLLGELPALVQLLGGLLILGGVVLVKLDEQPQDREGKQEPLEVEPILEAAVRG